MRSKKGVYGAVVVLAGVAIALACAFAFNGAGASEIIHLALGIGFLLFAAAVFDFPQSPTVAAVFGIGIGILGAIFLLQGISDLLHFGSLDAFAYGFLGSLPEKILGYVFLAWCVVLLVYNSHGRLRWLGIAVVILVVPVEAYNFATALAGEPPDATLRFLYLPLIAWVGLESREKPSPPNDI